MSKKNKSSSTGTTVNPAPQPAAVPAQVQGKPTASPLLGSRDSGAAAEAVDFEAKAKDFLANSIIGSDDDTTKLAQALSSTEAAGDAADEQPQPGATAEDSNPSEENAEATDSGEDNDSTEAGDEPEGETAATDDETEAEGESDEASGDPNKQLRGLKRKADRMKKALDRRDEELEQLREENERLKTGTGQGETSPVPVAVSSDEQSLLARVAKLEDSLEFIESNPDGAVVGEQSFTAEQMRKARRDFERQLRATEAELTDLQRGRKARTEQLGQVLATRHPWMMEKGNALRATVDAFLNRYPALKAIPEGRIMAADAIAYQQQLNKAQANGTGTKPATNGHTNGHANGRPAVPAPRPPAARPPGRPGAQPVSVNGQRASAGAAHKRYMETGDLAAGKELVASLLADD